MATSCGVLWKEKYATLPTTTNTTNPITTTALPHENFLGGWTNCPPCVGGVGVDTGGGEDILRGTDMDDAGGVGVV